MKPLQRVFFPQGLVFSLLFLLTACGFHLRGQEPLPPQLNSIYISSKAPYDNLIKILTARLEKLKVAVVPTPAQASYTLQLVGESFSETAQSVSVDTQFRQYQLYYSANFILIDHNNKVILPEFSLGSTRYYSTQTGQALGSSFEKNRLHGEMQREVVSQLLNRLRSTAVKRALANENNARTTQ